MDTRKYSSQRIAIHCVAALVLLPFLALAAYSHPYYDDYAAVLELRHSSFASYFIYNYQNWSGRYAFLFANGAYPLRFGGMQLYHYTVAGLILSLVGSCYALAWGLTVGSRLRLAAKGAMGSGLVIALLILFPSPAEGFYWALSSYTYLLPIVVGFGGFAMGCGHAAAPPGSIQQRVLFVGLMVAAALFPGFSEFSAGLSLLLVAGLLLAFPKARRSYWGVALTAVTGATIMLLAPGNFNRLHTSPHEWHLAWDSGHALIATAYTLLNWTAFPAFWPLLALALPLLGKVAAGNGPVARLVRLPFLWPILLIVGLTGCYIFGYVVLHCPPLLRVRNILYAYFIVTGLLSIIGLIQFAQRQGWALPRVSPAVLFALLALALLSDGNGRLRGEAIGRSYSTVGQAYRDLISGDAQRYDIAVRRRYSLLQTTAADSVALQSLPTAPNSIFLYDIGNNPNHWCNKLLARYFHKKAVWVQ
ncbi:DUF6056 family protein [Hymenobacter sp. UYCo722]|uniref:DUF6056 family protein n=1 Tax=Hymenobacter sp. UYCo722 TaxID=3156335 RepID=UPI003394AD38